MNRLSKIISEEIRKKGPITFARFMELALYHPKLGYYGSGNVRIGKDGDFYTSPSVSTAFGEIIANFVSKAYETINTNDFTILEIGAGKGYLALDILDSLKKINNPLYSHSNYIIVEQNPRHIEYGKNLLKNHKTRVKWFKYLENLKNTVSGVVISNELFDSLPFNRLIAHENKIKEIYVEGYSDGFSEKYGELSSQKIIDYLNKYNLELEEGQEIEVNLNTETLLNHINTCLDQGFVLTIDYGSLYESLYSSTRKKGTHKCFYKHQINDDPYQNIGKQDITAEVNFSDIIHSGKLLGLNKVIYTTQGQFLIDWGIINLLERETAHPTSERGKNIYAIKNLFMPDLMGNRYKVLIQEKGANTNSDLFYPSQKMKVSFGTL